MRIKPGLFPLPDYAVDASYVFTYNGNSYSYMARINHLATLSGLNRSILLAVFGENYEEELEKIYGYPPGAGDWPVWRVNDSTAGQRVFNALVERGVEIILE